MGVGRPRTSAPAQAPSTQASKREACACACACVCARAHVCARLLCVCVCVYTRKQHAYVQSTMHPKRKAKRFTSHVSCPEVASNSPKSETRTDRTVKSLFFWLFEPKPKYWLRTPGVERKPIAQKNTRCAMQLRFTVSARTGPGFNRILVDAPCRPACRHSMQVVNRSGDESEWS